LHNFNFFGESSLFEMNHSTLRRGMLHTLLAQAVEELKPLNETRKLNFLVQFIDGGTGGGGTQAARR
jgi:hypothetical protein